MRKFIIALTITCLSVLIGSAQTPTPTPKAAEEDTDVVKISTPLIQIDISIKTRMGSY
jgi:hypothetical protein